MSLQIDQILSTAQKSALLETVVFRSSTDDDYFVVKGENGFEAVICETHLGAKRDEVLHHVVIRLTPCETLDEAVLTTLHAMIGDNAGEDSAKPAVRSMAPLVKHWA